MLAVSLGGDTVANVVAIGAEEMGDLSKGSATKRITVRQCCSPDTRPPFPGSPSDLLRFVGGPERTDGWIEGSVDWCMEAEIRCDAPSQAAGLPQTVTVSRGEAHAAQIRRGGEMLRVICVFGGEGRRVKRRTRWLSIISRASPPPPAGRPGRLQRCGHKPLSD